LRKIAPQNYNIKEKKELVHGGIFFHKVKSKNCTVYWRNITPQSERISIRSVWQNLPPQSMDILFDEVIGGSFRHEIY
jgi:hypothetical protein